MVIRRQSTLALAAALLLGLGACAGGGADGTDDAGGGGGDHPSNDNRVQATLKMPGATFEIRAARAGAVEGYFGAGVSDSVLVFWVPGEADQLITAAIDTSQRPLPATIPMESPPDGRVWLTLKFQESEGVWESTGLGTLTVNQCPDGHFAAFEGTFNAIELRKNDSEAVAELDGSFNLRVATYDGALVCGTGPTEDVGGAGDGSGGGCGLTVCADGGVCCPYLECFGGCASGCASGVCSGGDISGCTGCLDGCWTQCGAAQECRDAIGALYECVETHGCDPTDDDDGCEDTHCCPERSAAF